MSLRFVHLLFIAICVALAAFFAAWAGGRYRADHAAGQAVAAAASIGVGVALVVYAVRFQRKTRHR